LAGRIENGANASDVAAVVVVLWREVDTALRPVIGQRGVVALFNRSVQLAAVGQTWLLSVRQELNSELQFPAIAEIFAGQDAAVAISGGDALLLAFHQLLSSLIGASLAERLLRPAFSPVNKSTPTQDAAC
jgi:hypothetical protein